MHSPFLFISGYFIVELLDNNLANGPAIIGDLSEDSPNRIKHMATIQCVIAVGASLGPIAGGQLANHQFIVQISYALPFMIAALIAILGLITINFCPETLIKTPELSYRKWSPISIARDYWMLLRTKNIAWLLLLLALCQISWSCYYQFIPPTLKNIFYFPPEKVGFFVGVIAFWLIIATSVLIRILLNFFNYLTLMKIAVGSVIIGTLLGAWAASNHIFLTVNICSGSAPYPPLWEM